MNAKTLKALRESIAHWKRLATGKAKENEAPQCEHCALCVLFHSNFDEARDCCAGCPIAKKTGRTECYGTPFQAAAVQFEFHGIDSSEFRTAAQAELAFLKSLLPKGKQ